ncbi:peptidyl-tRNA hydrolase [Candidatus Woesearchaeota archaeon]|nr:peptidyl-tRNA hydrolase [Candidatus Woesearchaeota archaeon]
MAQKLVIAVRKDLNLPKGKLAVQVAHAAVDAAMKSEEIEQWVQEGGKKIAVWAENRTELFRLKKMAAKKGLVTAIIKDAGKTVLKPGTVTCLGIGPADEKKIDEITGKLKII